MTGENDGSDKIGAERKEKADGEMNFELYVFNIPGRINTPACLAYPCN
jgi:hypothetical protein